MPGRQLGRHPGRYGHAGQPHLRRIRPQRLARRAARGTARLVAAFEVLVADEAAGFGFARGDPIDWRRAWGAAFSAGFRLRRTFSTPLRLAVRIIRALNRLGLRRKSIPERDLRTLEMQDLRRAIGFVSQDVFLFHGTVRDNIAYGDTDAPLERIIEAARVKKGMNVLDVNLAMVRKRLLAQPWIANAEIRREIPAGLYIKVQEHTPLAIIDLGRKFLLNENGRVFKEWTDTDPADSPANVIFSGSPPKEAILRCTHRRAAFWSSSP